VLFDLVCGDVPAFDEENDMTELRKRMSDAMVLRGFAARTQQSYLACVAGLARHYGRSPERIDTAQIQAYLLHLITERKLAYASVNQAVCARVSSTGRAQARSGRLRHSDGQGAQAAAAGVLARGSVAACSDCGARPARPRAAGDDLRGRAARLGGLCAATCRHRSAPDRMCLKVRQAKAAKDRYTLLSPRLLDSAPILARCAGPGAGCSPIRAGERPIDPKTGAALYWCGTRCRRPPLRGRHPHPAPRFATHLLEAGVDIHTIQRLLGHGHVEHDHALLSSGAARLTGTTSPLELLDTLSNR
jgi:integrase/recombinase XerD